MAKRLTAEELAVLRDTNRRMAIECATELARRHRTCAGCDWQHHCEQTRALQAAARLAALKSNPIWRPQ